MHSVAFQKSLLDCTQGLAHQNNKFLTCTVSESLSHLITYLIIEHKVDTLDTFMPMSFYFVNNVIQFELKCIFFGSRPHLAKRADIDYIHELVNKEFNVKTTKEVVNIA